MPGTTQRCLAAAAGAALLAFRATAASAYRPFDGTDADVAREGRFELELGSAYTVRSSYRRYLTVPALVLNLGIADRWELVIDASGIVPVDASPGGRSPYVDDADVLFKTLLRSGRLQGDQGISVATELGALLPRADGKHFGAVADVTFSEEWQLLTLHLNLEAARLPEDLNLGFAGLIAEGPREWLRPVAELTATRATGRSTIYSGLLGAIWTAGDTLAIDVGVRADVSQDGRGAELRCGLTWGVPVWHSAAPREPNLARNGSRS